MTNWIDVCCVEDLQIDSGICVLVTGIQIAVFYQFISENIYAISNFDPFSGVNVLSRGLIGDIDGQPVVASPLYKQHFNLKTGLCLEDGSVRILTYPVRIQGDSVQIII